jgi:adenylate cyclase
VGRAVRTPPRILIADDNPTNVRLLRTRLAADGYEVAAAADGEQALAAAHAQRPDLILLDVMMPKVDGLTVCRQLKADPTFPFTPIIIVTAMTDARDVVAGLEAGADEYLTKPVDQPALVARVRSMLRIKALHDTVHAQAEELARWNATLEQRVAEQVAELARVGRLKRFFSPQLAELIVAGGAEDPLRTHRREITVVFLDLRGFTAFAETAEPEEIMGLLHDYHAEMGALIVAHGGTLERFTGDGMMVFFNDPVPVPDPAARAVRMAVTMRDRVRQQAAGWQKLGWQLALGVGVAQGYATIGAIGFEGRWDYAAVGTVTNLASRLCGEAEGWQILVSPRVAAAVEDVAEMEEVGPLTLKGFARPVPARRILRLTDCGGPRRRGPSGTIGGAERAARPTLALHPRRGREGPPVGSLRPCRHALSAGAERLPPGLPAMAEAFQRQLGNPAFAELAFEDRVGLLADAEWTHREQRKLRRRLRQANLRRQASLEDIDWHSPRRGIDKALVHSLATCAWIAQHRNLILIGPTGIGKSWLGEAFAERACRSGSSACCVRASRLFHDLHVARGDGSSTRVLPRPARGRCPWTFRAGKSSSGFHLRSGD